MNGNNLHVHVNRVYFLLGDKGTRKSVEGSNVINVPKCNIGPRCKNFWP